MAARVENPAARTETALPVLSILVPCYDEGESLPELFRVLREAFPAAAGAPVEFVIVDDGSRDGTAALLAGMAREDPRVLPVLRRHRGGQSAALSDALRVARGRWIAHLDGDLQNDPRDLPAMLALAETGFDAVFGFRAERHDRWSRRAASRIAGTVRRAALHDHIRDIGCSTRVVRREALMRLPQARDLHRYLPALLERAGWRIAQMPVRHAPRRHGQSKYTNVGRGVRGLLDLARMARLARRLEREDEWRA